jgi:hypothetical protein
MNKIRGIKEFFEPFEAQTFIENSLLGKMNKNLLQDERLLEINSMELMDTTSITHHMESITELQIMCLVIFGVWE